MVGANLWQSANLAGILPFGHAMCPIMTQRRCLLVDDDAISALFAGEWLDARGWHVEHAATLAAADGLLAQGRFELWLVDRRLPDGDGLAWLGEHLANGMRSGQRCLLTSGEWIAADALPAGVDSLRKPLDLDWLATWLERPMERAPAIDAAVGGGNAPLLDDASALARFGGNRAALRTLRQMLLREIASSGDWRAGLGQASLSALDPLHRLRAGCALTGCTQLAAVAGELEAALRGGRPAQAYQLQALDDALRATTLALAAE